MSDKDVAHRGFVRDPPAEDSEDDRLVSEGGSVLGSGAYGTTYRMRNLVDNGVFAVKQVNTTKASRLGITLKDILSEANLQMRINNPYIARYYTSYESGKRRLELERRLKPSRRLMRRLELEQRLKPR
jgi:hypothetical protein